MVEREDITLHGRIMTLRIRYGFFLYLCPEITPSRLPKSHRFLLHYRTYPGGPAQEYRTSKSKRRVCITIIFKARVEPYAVSILSSSFLSLSPLEPSSGILPSCVLPSCSS